MLSRGSLSRKLIWCRDLIRSKFFTRKRYKEEEEEGGGGEAQVGGGWFEELPDDVMQLILKGLPLSDYLNCRGVSPCWRAAIDSKRWLPAAHQLPWLVTSSTLGIDMLASYIETDDDDCSRIKSHRRIYKKKKNNSTAYCSGSIEGWLIITNSRNYVHSFFLWNPVSGARVNLPSHPRCGTYFPTLKLVASSVPNLQRSCYVTCLHFKKIGLLAFCTPTDKSWTLIEAEKDLEFRDIEILDGKLYAVGRKALDFVMVFDIHLDTHDSRLHTYTSQRLVTLHSNIKSIGQKIYHLRCYLAKCSESKDLFMVLYQDPCFALYQNNGFEGLFQVLKLEYSNVTTSPQWVEIADLGDRALLVGTLNNKFITCHDKTLEIRNCIYFVLHKTNEGYTSGVFSLTDRGIKRITLPEHHRRFCVLDQSTWFTPNPC